MHLEDDILIGRIQDIFTRKVRMTTKKVNVIAKGVKLLDDALKRCDDSVPVLQKKLWLYNVNISLTALYNAQSGTSGSLKPDVLVALVHIAFDGDWIKGGKALESDFLNKGKK